MMVRYVVRSTHFEGEFVLAFDKAGILREFVNGAELTDKQFDYLLAKLPRKQDDLPALIGDSKTLRVVQLSDDLSFAAFWNAYGHKVGHKAKAEKLWNNLSDGDRQMVLESIMPYKYYLMTHPNIQPLYPETYVSQRRFEVDYRALAKG